MRAAEEDEMTKLFKLVTPAALAAVLALLSVTADAADIRARIPFEFTVNGRTLSAGTYTVSDSNHVLFVRGDSAGAFAQTIGVGSPRDNQLRLVFEKYGDVYVLRQAWTGSAGRELPRSRHERELAQAVKKGQVAGVERIVIPAL